MKGKTIYSFAVLLNAFTQNLLDMDWNQVRKVLEQGDQSIFDEYIEQWQALQEIGNAAFEVGKK